MALNFMLFFFVCSPARENIPESLIIRTNSFLLDYACLSFRVLLKNNTFMSFRSFYFHPRHSLRFSWVCDEATQINPRQNDSHSLRWNGGEGRKTSIHTWGALFHETDNLISLESTRFVAEQCLWRRRFKFLSALCKCEKERCKWWSDLNDERLLKVKQKRVTNYLLGEKLVSLNCSPLDAMPETNTIFIVSLGLGHTEWKQYLNIFYTRCRKV